MSGWCERVGGVHGCCARVGATRKAATAAVARMRGIVMRRMVTPIAPPERLQAPGFRPVTLSGCQAILLERHACANARSATVKDDQRTACQRAAPEAWSLEPEAFPGGIIGAVQIAGGRTL